MEGDRRFAHVANDPRFHRPKQRAPMSAGRETATKNAATNGKIATSTKGKGKKTSRDLDAIDDAPFMGFDTVDERFQISKAKDQGKSKVDKYGKRISSKDTQKKMASYNALATRQSALASYDYKPLTDSYSNDFPVVLW